MLNNEGDNSGDACAGEVMCALRGHGWVISSEEQDAHELFHAVTATIDEELMNAVTLPSLLDVSWIELADSAALQNTDDGIVVRSDCWRQNRGGNSEKLSESGYCKKLRHPIVRIVKNGTADDTKSELNGNDDPLHTSESDVEQVSVITAVTQNCGNEIPPKDNCTYNSSCDANGCENDVVTNGHSNDLSSVAQKCKTDVKVDFSAQKCIIDRLEGNSVSKNHTDNNSEMGNGICKKEEDVVHENIHSESNSQDQISSVEQDEQVSDDPVSSMKSKNAGLKSEGSASVKKARSKHHDSPFQGYLASQLQCTLCGFKVNIVYCFLESLFLANIGSVALVCSYDKYSLLI